MWRRVFEVSFCALLLLLRSFEVSLSVVEAAAVTLGKLVQFPEAGFVFGLFFEQTLVFLVMLADQFALRVDKSS